MNEHLPTYLQCTPPLDQMSLYVALVQRAPRSHKQRAAAVRGEHSIPPHFQTGKVERRKRKGYQIYTNIARTNHKPRHAHCNVKRLVLHHGPFERRKIQEIPMHNISNISNLPTTYLPSLRYLGIHNSIIISSDFMPDFLHFVSEPIPNSFVFIIVIVATVTIAVAATIPILTSAVLRGGSRL